MLLISSIAFGQNPQQTDQLILKIKEDARNPSKELLGQNFIGNHKIDRVTKKHQAISIKRIINGNKSDQPIYIIQFPKGTNIQQVIDEYYKTGEIKYAKPRVRSKRKIVGEEHQ